MGFFSGIWGKIKAAVIIILTAALPLLYILGRRDGGSSQEIDRLKNASETNEEIADFYRRHVEYVDRDPIRDRDDLIERLRGKGL